MRRRPGQLSASRKRAAALRAASRRVDIDTLREACRVFDFDLTHKEQLAIAEEVAITRAGELCLAFSNVVRVSFGYRRRRDLLNRKQLIVPQPCVRFTVANKRYERRTMALVREIPSRLLAFCRTGGNRRLCAVPTDVEDIAPHLSVRAEAGPASISVNWNGGSESGMIACALRRDFVPDSVYGLSCRHVLSVSAQFFDEPTWGAVVRVGSLSDSMVLGQTLSIAGDLGPSDSFDAQLFEVTNVAGLQQALPLPEVTGYARTAAELPTNYDIVTSRGRINATFVDFVDEGGYEVSGRDIRHRRLVQSHPETGTDAGDSGSPVISKDGRLLLGMHVAGLADLDRQGYYLTISYMIPAWDLLNPANYHT